MASYFGQKDVVKWQYSDSIKLKSSGAMLQVPLNAYLTIIYFQEATLYVVTRKRIFR